MKQFLKAANKLIIRKFECRTIANGNEHEQMKQFFKSRNGFKKYKYSTSTMSEGFWSVIT